MTGYALRHDAGQGTECETQATINSPLIWMNFVLAFFAYDVMQAMMVSLFCEEAFLSSSFWFTAEGEFIGLFIGYIATRFGGEGKKTVGR